MQHPIVVLGGMPPDSFGQTAQGQILSRLAGSDNLNYVWVAGSPANPDVSQGWAMPEAVALSGPTLQKKWLSARIRSAGFRQPVLVIVDLQFAALALRCNELLRVYWASPPAAGAEARNIHSLATSCDVSLDWEDHDVESVLAKLRVGIRHAGDQRLARRKRVLFLYDHYSCHISTVREYIEAFREYSRHEITYAIGANKVPMVFHLDLFDVIVVHYSVRLCVEEHLQEKFAEQIESFLGPKLLFIQDEYDKTETARAAMRRLGFDVVFTCVPQKSIELVYPPASMPGIKFVSVLTGAVPESYHHMHVDGDPSKRPIFLGYRGRELPYWYGKLGREKYELGIEVKKRLEGRGLALDIEWSDEKRIYGRGWYEFIGNCRAQLGSESGANLFDDDGSIRGNIERALKDNPALTFEEAHSRFMAHKDGHVRMNQVSPRVFEAIAFRTALVLFEGEYSGVIEPGIHFIPLKKDYSNLDEVIAKLKDDRLVEEMTARAYRDVIESGRYDYRSFVAVFDAEVDKLPAYASRLVLTQAYVGQRQAGADWGFDFDSSVRYYPSAYVFDKGFVDGRIPHHVPPSYKATRQVLDKATTKALLRQLLLRVWRPAPVPLKFVARPLVRGLRAVVRRLWK